MRSLRRGQAEVVGGIIAVSVLLLSVAAVYFLLTSTQSTAAVELSRRTSFESERTSERLAVVYDPGLDRCALKNVGPIPVEIVRLWYGGDPVDLEGPAILQPGEQVTQVAGVDVEVVEVAVTRRGNVVSVRSLCEEARRGTYGGGPYPFSSENILDYARMSRGMAEGYLYVNITTGRGSSGSYAVVYKVGQQWLCSSKFNRTQYTQVPRWENWDLDLDGNNVNELITINSGSCPEDPSGVTEYGPGPADKGISAALYVFKNLLEISGEEDVVTVYFKFIVILSGGGVPQEVSFQPLVTISGGSVGLSTPAPTATAGSPGIAIVSGYAVFPLRAFGLRIDSGVYDLLIELRISPSSSVYAIYVRLEYVAVVGTAFYGPWR